MRHIRTMIALWTQAVRAPFFTASVIPVLFAAAFAMWTNQRVSWSLLPPLILSVVFLHAGTNTINDYYDFKNGVDKKTTFGSSRVLVDGLMTPRHILIGSYVCFTAGFAIGLIPVVFRGIPVLILGIIGLIGGYSYSGKPLGLKYTGLGECMVFLCMGPLLVVSAYYVLTGGYSAQALYASIPIGFLVTAILHANNIRDSVSDRTAGIQTFTTLIGFRAAKTEYYILLLGAYLGVCAMSILKIFPMQSLIVFFTLPLAIKNMRAVSCAEQEEIITLADIDIRTARLHLLFCLVCIISFCIGAVKRI
ncbi:MAG: 1,4-dihydroxy-2-naphthoate octaprenyltransferase [Candidatus Omnitrophica bacterium]|nr:1,4-dihydroxy-2-naphthoate octaprenyltransferase [Candidatus Omnitrophota bacterium]